jgi:hypothetical protein
MWRDAPVGADMTILWQNFFASVDFSFVGGVQTYTPFNFDHFFALVFIDLFLDLYWWEDPDQQ